MCIRDRTIATTFGGFLQKSLLEGSSKKRRVVGRGYLGLMTLQRTPPLSLAGLGQAADRERHPHGVCLTGMAQVITRHRGDTSEPIADGVGVHEQDPGRGLEAAAAVQIGGGCL